MSRLSIERDHLARADDDIADAERRITVQMLRIYRLREGEHDTREAEKLLTALQHTLDTWNEHRTEIVREIARLELLNPLYKGAGGAGP
jgi:hypothetical protein